MNLTNHINVLTALEKRALRYRKKFQVQLDTDEVLYNDSVDETGNVSTSYLINPDAECKERYLYEKKEQNNTKWRKLRESQMMY